MAMPRPAKLVALKPSEIVKSFGCALSAGANGGVDVESAYRAAMFATGLCAMLIAAVAVSVGCVPVVPPTAHW